MVNFERLAASFSGACVILRGAKKDASGLAAKAVSQALRNGVPNGHMRSRVVPALLFFVFACGISRGQEAAAPKSPGGQAAEKPAGAASPSESLRVGPGDEVDVAVFGAPELAT